MPPAYPREFREDVIRVARNREPGIRLGAVRSLASVGCSPMSVSGVTYTHVLRRDRSGGARSARSVRRHQAGSRLSAPRPSM